MRTSRLAGAAAFLVVVGLSVPAWAQPAAPPVTCPPPGLGPPTACVASQEGGPTTTVAADGPAPHDPGPALWVGVVFGVSGLAGIAFAAAGVPDREPETRR